VQAQHDAGVSQELVGGGVGVRLQDGGVRDAVGVHEIVAAAQGLGVLELLGEGALGVFHETIGQIDKRGGAAPVAEVGGAQLVEAEGGQIVRGGWHRNISVTKESRNGSSPHDMSI
jgi:hypothetical protein